MFIYLPSLSPRPRSEFCEAPNKRTETVVFHGSAPTQLLDASSGCSDGLGICMLKLSITHLRKSSRAICRTSKPSKVFLDCTGNNHVTGAPHICVCIPCASVLEAPTIYVRLWISEKSQTQGGELCRCPVMRKPERTRQRPIPACVMSRRHGSLAHSTVADGGS
jgi:hypothetical protein